MTKPESGGHMGTADGELLRQFVSTRSEQAFEELTRRHGGMVFGVCRRLLEDPHDAEDAFQAAFLVLARRARKMRKSDSVASWLHGVALRVALNARRQAARRREHERRVAEMTVSERETAWRDIGPVLDEELGRLPERLRAPVVLCYLESKSTEQAATELGWTHGALRGRLAKARELLRGRLSRRGIVVGAAILAAAISENASAAAVPPACLASTVEAATAASAGGMLAAGLSAKAASLAESALKGIFWSQVKVAVSAVVLGVGLVAGTTLTVARLRQADQKGHQQAHQQAHEEKPVPAAVPEEPGSTAAAPVEAAGPDGSDGGKAPARASGPLAELPRSETEPGRKPGDVAEAARRRTRGGRRPAPIELPEAVLQSAQALYPGGDIEDFERITKGQQTVYEIDLEVGGRDVELLLAEDGAILEVEEEIDVAEIPQAVAAALARLWPQATVEEVRKETDEGRTSFTIELALDGEELDVELTPDGEVLRVKEREPDDQRDDDERDDDEREGRQNEEAAPAVRPEPDVF